MKHAKVAVAVVAALVFAGLFLPCVRVTYQQAAPVPPAEATLLVGVTLLRNVPMPCAIHLLSIPVLSAFASVLLLGLPLSPRATMWAGLGGAAFIVVPILSIPRVRMGTLAAWHFTLTPPFAPARILFGFHAYQGLLGALAVAYLALGVVSLVASRRAEREGR